MTTVGGLDETSSLAFFEPISSISSSLTIDLLSGIERGEDLLPHRLFRNVRDELFGDLQIDVRFQERHAHLAHRRFDFQFREFAAFGQFGKYVIESFRKR